MSLSNESVLIIGGSHYSHYGGHISIGKPVRRRGLHSHRACMIPNISRSCIGYLRSGAENIFEEKAIGSHLLSCCCSRRAPEATNEALEKILKGLTKSGSLRTGLEVKAS